jgi:membrane associated rhomboid family serine protease
VPSAESADALIPARSQRQAMDWSLVLLSQGIESVIQETEVGWGLVIPSHARQRALEVLRQYHHENRSWRWHRRLRWPEFSFHFGVLIWCLLLIGVHWWSSLPGTHLKSLGTLHSLAVLNGAWWQLFTATALHADLAHLMANLTTGFLLLGLAMGRYGASCALLATYLAGAAGNLCGVLLRAEPYHGLGASGIVMGGLGLLAVQSLTLYRTRPFLGRYLVMGLMACGMLFVLLGADPASDVLAHLGGLAAGLVFGVLLAAIPQHTLLTTKINLGAGVLLGLLFLVTWAAALS